MYLYIEMPHLLVGGASPTELEGTLVSCSWEEDGDAPATLRLHVKELRGEKTSRNPVAGSPPRSDM